MAKVLLDAGADPDLVTDVCIRTSRYRDAYELTDNLLPPQSTCTATVHKSVGMGYTTLHHS